MRVLLDTNVLIAAFITHGTCSNLFEHCILNELEGHLRKKFKFSEDDVREMMGMLNAVVKIVEPIPLKEAICRDGDDDMSLATALTGSVDCIVTGDKDLTDLTVFRHIPILKPAEFSSVEADRRK